MRPLPSLLITPFALALALAGGGPSPQAGLRPVTCPAYLTEVFRGVRAVQCSELPVPVRHEAPGGKHLNLFVVRLKSPQANPKADPIVYLHGGPGGSIHGTLADFSSRDLRALSTDRDVVLFDQRGAGSSDEDLSCPLNTSEAQQYAIIAKRGFMQVLTSADVLNCAAALHNQGHDLGGYTSAQSAADVDALRQALGAPQVNLYGVSYGTRLAQEVMRRYPSRVRSAVLDSPVPAGVNYQAGLDALFERALTARLRACTADALCADTYPNIDARHKALLQHLAVEQPTVNLLSHRTGSTYTVPVTRSNVLQLLFQTLYAGGNPVGVLGTVNAFSQGVYTDYARVLQSVPRDRIDVLPYAVMCPETQGLSVSAARALPVGDAVREAITPFVEFEQRICASWPVVGDATLRAPVKSDIPTLMLSGELDIITPPEDARDLLPHFTRGQWVNFRWNGHGQLRSGQACVANLIYAFWRAPLAQVDGTCAARQD